MPELRQDIITGEWVVIATERSKRPESFTAKAEVGLDDRSNCPFCYGHEAMTPPEIMAYSEEERKPNTPGWKVRVVPNKFPAFSPEGVLKEFQYGIYRAMTGIGSHEVIIHSPDHFKDLDQLSVEQIDLILSAYRERYLALSTVEEYKYILIIVNHGPRAGASLRHPHSQLFAIPMIPHLLETEISGAERYFREHGKCVYCQIISFEIEEKVRVVAEDDRFVILEPYASQSPFETWIIPKNHLSNFEEITDCDKRSLAGILKGLLKNIADNLGDPPFNYYLHTSPLHQRDLKHWHWHLEILPRLTIRAGFELGSRLIINVTTPESAAEFLRAGYGGAKLG